MRRWRVWGFRPSRRTLLASVAASVPAAGAAAFLSERAFGLDLLPPYASPRRRRHERRPSDLARAWAQKLRGITLRRLRPRHQATLLSGVDVAFELRSVEPHHFPGWTDSNSPAFWQDGRLVLFNSAEQPVRSVGTSLETLGDPVDVWCTPCDRPGGRWLEAVWPDPSSGTLYGWYHFEPADLACLTAPVIGAATSRDGGLTWTDQGVVLQNPHPIDCAHQNGYFAGGNGDFHVIPDREERYFYFLYSNYAGPAAEQGVCLARSPFAERGQPGTVRKLFRGAFDQPGLGGRATPVFPSSTGWAGPHVESFWGPSVHWNEHLQRYVALINHTHGSEWEQEGVYIAFSPDLQRWTAPQKFLESNVWYPQLIGLFPGGTDTRAGQTSRLYVSGASEYELVFI
jgi:hypothetical protein